MSTKIYYGMRVKAETLADVKDLVKKIKEKHDAYVFSLFTETKTYTVTALHEILKDFDIDLCIGYDRETKSFYMNPMGMHGAVLESCYFIPELEEFGYWDNTDPDEGATEEQWKEREEVWSRLLPADYDSFGEQMFVISVKTCVFALIRKIEEQRKQ